MDKIEMLDAEEDHTGPVAYREWLGKFGGGWRFHDADDLPAGRMESRYEPLYTKEKPAFDLFGFGIFIGVCATGMAWIICRALA